MILADYNFIKVHKSGSIGFVKLPFILHREFPELIYSSCNLLDLYRLHQKFNQLETIASRICKNWDLGFGERVPCKTQF
jgi:hypothetical protein